MGLNLDEIRKKIQEGKKRQILNTAKYHQLRIAFHAQTRITGFDLSQPVTDFLAFVKNLLPDDKFKIFQTLFRYPVKTNEICGICFDKLSRIFDGRNPAFNYQFMTPEQREDWEYYRQNVLNEPDIWTTKGWDFFQTQINSVLIVDMPIEQDPADRYPRPYFYWLPIDSVLDYEANPTTGQMYYIAFRQHEDKIAVFDDEYYRIFREGKDHNVGELLIENKHDLGYCPARFFWDVPLSLDKPDVKKSPLTNQLEALDWFLFYHISKRHLDLYGSYPIYSGYEQSCDFSNSENGDYCDGGFLKDKQGFYRLDPAGLLMKCPKCGQSRITGAGSFVEIPIPDGDKQPDLRNPVQMLSVDRQSLDYNVQEEERLKNNIITAVVGTNEEITTRDALNEQQVQANFESQSTILNRVKKGFESAQKFVDETICHLRYGEYFVSAKINYGTEFFLANTTELRNRYKIAKESGASEAELDALQNQILETEYRNNPTQLQRMLILAELEPYRHLTRNEVLELYDKKIVSENDMRIKLNFATFVRRFERQYLNISEFGYNMPYDAKINFITNKFNEYASENKQRAD